MTINVDLWFMVALLLIFFIIGMLIGVGVCLSISGRDERFPGVGRRYRY